MYFFLSQSILPVVFAVLVVLITWYLWRRMVKGPGLNSGEETHTVTAKQKVSVLVVFTVWAIVLFIFLLMKILCLLALSLWLIYTNSE